MHLALGNQVISQKSVDHLAGNADALVRTEREARTQLFHELLT